MRQTVRNLVPSMFHRRLILLGVGAGLVVLLLMIQLGRLTLVEAATHRVNAEKALERRDWINTARGRITDRRGRVLAMDDPSYSIAVRFPVITGEWAYAQARDDANDDRARWDALSFEQRESLIAELREPYDQQVEMLWQMLGDLGGVQRDELERDKTRLVARIQRLASDVWSKRLKNRAAEIAGPITLADVADPIQEQVAAHVLLPDVPDDVAVQVRSFMHEARTNPGLAVWNQVKLEPTTKRRYPLETMTVTLDRTTLPGPLKNDEPLEVTVEGVATHLVGLLRPVWREDVTGEDARPFRVTLPSGDFAYDMGGYRDGDLIGSLGAERAFETALRGKRGEIVRQLDTDRTTRHDPTPGRDVALSIDVRLQARVQAVLTPRVGLTQVQPWFSQEQERHGQPLNAAAVVMDVSTGQVLAAVSMPSMKLRQVREEPDTVFDDHVDMPYLNRVIARPYQPGSTVKPIVFTIAATLGQVGLDESIVCRGHLDRDAATRYRCWIFKRYMSAHGPLAVAEATARSCNIFFYTLGRRLGPEKLTEWYTRFGLGHRRSNAFAEEVPGDLPDLAKAHLPNAPGFLPADGIFMAIGQGPIRWTPLQAAAAYATLARGGVYVEPTFLSAGPLDQRQHPVDLNLNQASLDLALQGLWEAANEDYGTTHHLSTLDREPIFNIQGVKVYGKSGTAAAVPHRIDSDEDGRITADDQIVKEGDHAWVMVLAQRPGSPRPDFAIAVVVEYAGSGGTVSGPIANQVLHALRQEGYL